MSAPYVDPTAQVDPRAELGEDAQVWNWSNVREGARIGPGCRIGQGVYVDHDVTVGAGSKVQNGVSIFHGVTIGASVFVGPHATFTNDRVPRADNEEWAVVETVVEDHASVGANATIVCGVRLGRACMVAAGAVVTHDVPPHALVVGAPARVLDYVRLDGTRLYVGPDADAAAIRERVA